MCWRRLSGVLALVDVLAVGLSAGHELSQELQRWQAARLGFSQHRSSFAERRFAHGGNWNLS
jgi:hypothetical protein